MQRARTAPNLPAVGAPLFTAAVVACDQLTKARAQHSSALVLPVRNPDYVLGHFGPGAALVVVSSLAVIAFVVAIGRSVTQLGVSSLLPALAAGGMLGNLLDRLRFGAVRDFIVTPWAIVNVADLAVIVGLLALVGACAWRVHALQRASYRLSFDTARLRVVVVPAR